MSTTKYVFVENSDKCQYFRVETSTLSGTMTKAFSISFRSILVVEWLILSTSDHETQGSNPA